MLGTRTTLNFSTALSHYLMTKDMEIKEGMMLRCKNLCFDGIYTGDMDFPPVVVGKEYPVRHVAPNGKVVIITAESGTLMLWGYMIDQCFEVVQAPLANIEDAVRDFLRDYPEEARRIAKEITDTLPVGEVELGKTRNNPITAVQWFYQRILSKDIESVYEQALEMEKQQIVKSWEDGYWYSGTNEEYSKTVNEYYYEHTYGGNK